MDDVLESIVLGRLDADDKLAERTRAWSSGRDGWTIRYVFGNDAEGSCLQIYPVHTQPTTLSGHRVQTQRRHGSFDRGDRVKKSTRRAVRQNLPVRVITTLGNTD